MTLTIIIIIIIIIIVITIYYSETEHNIQVAPLKFWVYKILKSGTNFIETATRFTTHWSSGNWSHIEKELETGVRLID